MSFAHPYYFWSLLGLLVPIGIHLWSKKQANIIKIGSVQLLSESSSKQSSSILLNEYFLLLIRMLLLLLVTLVLVQPQWQSKQKNSALTYIVEPSLTRNTEFMTRLGELANGNEIRLLRKTFPLWDVNTDAVKSNEISNYWSLASEMDALKTDSIVVFTKGYVKGLKGMRPHTNHRINWIVKDTAQVIEKPLVAYQKEEDFQLISAQSTSNRSSISSRNINFNDGNFTLNTTRDSLLITKSDSAIMVPIRRAKPIEVSVVYTDSLVQDKRYIEVAFAALSKYLNQKINVESMVDSQLDSLSENYVWADLTLWLSEKPLPISYQKLVVFTPDEMAQSLIVNGKSKNLYYLTKRITAENAVEERLSEKLLSIIAPYKELDSLLAEEDIRTLTEADLKTNYKNNSNNKVSKSSLNLSPYVWSLLFVFLVVERFVAYKRKL